MRQLVLFNVGDSRTRGSVQVATLCVPTSSRAARVIHRIQSQTTMLHKGIDTHTHTETHLFQARYLTFCAPRVAPLHEARAIACAGASWTPRLGTRLPCGPRRDQWFFLSESN